MPDLLEGVPPRHFGCIYADPPWHFQSRTPPNENSTSRRDVEVHYQTMPLAEIKALPVADHAAPTGCHLFLWTTGPHLPVALEVMAAWGFRYSGIGFNWIKLKKSFDPTQLRFTRTIDSDYHVSLGFTTRKNSELCLLGRRGGAKRIAKNIRELIISPRREHSRKPEEARERIERYCAGPYLELFGRETRPGWTVVGNQVGIFGATK